MLCLLDCNCEDKHKMSGCFIPALFLPDIVPNAQNIALKKWKLDSSPRYGPVFTVYITWKCIHSWDETAI